MHTDNNTTQFKYYMTVYMKSHTYHDDNIASRWHPTTLDACKHMRETRAWRPLKRELPYIGHTITAMPKGRQDLTPDLDLHRPTWTQLENTSPINLRAKCDHMFEGGVSTCTHSAASAHFSDTAW